MGKLELGNEGTAQIGGLGFAYKISKLKKKGMARQGHKFLEIILPYRSMMFSATAQIPMTVFQEAEPFMKACKELLGQILKENPVLANTVHEDHK